MKMKLYYVVKRVTNVWTEEKELDYIAGPFTFDGTCAYKYDLDFSYNYCVAEQEIEVN